MMDSFIRKLINSYRVLSLYKFFTVSLSKYALEQYDVRRMIFTMRDFYHKIILLLTKE